jgi:hypothetical protein
MASYTPKLDSFMGEISGIVGPKNLVNPIALQNCVVRSGEAVARVLDLSFVRVVIEPAEPWSSVPENEPFALELALDRFHFTAKAAVRGKGPGWIRLGFDRILHSAGAHLRSFLSPKRIGESIVEDWRTDTLRHYHGLNECELWFDPNGSLLFTYLDQTDHDAQFLIRLGESKAPLRIGQIRRAQYMELTSLDAELPLATLSDRDIYAKLGECRDILTNFRSIAQTEYMLKQRLLRAISDSLYSTSHKVEMINLRPPRPSPTV